MGMLGVSACLSRKSVDRFEPGMARMSKLERAMNLGLPGPDWEGQTFIEIVGKVAFEPHGRASECWETYYEARLPTVPYHWKSTKGWVPGKPEYCMFFRGRTIKEVLDKATAFMQENPHLSAPPSKRLVP